MTGRTSAFTVGFGALVAVALRYVPEYLRLLGARAWLVGLFGSAALGLSLVAPAVRRDVERAVGRRTTLVVGAVATGGLVLWLSAPFLGAFSAIVVAFEPWVWVLAGLPFLWLWRTDSSAFLSRLRRTNSFETDGGTNRRAPFLAALAVAGGLFVGAPDFLAGYQVLLALAASAGLTAAVAAEIRAVDDADESAAERSDGGSDPPDVPSASRARAALRELSSTNRSLLLGDVLVRFAVGMVAYFLVIVVVHHLRLEATAFGVRFQPEATFALLLAVETATAMAGGPLATRLAAEVSAKGVAVAGVLVAALVPLLVATAESVAVAVALFACLGGSLTTRPVRERLLAEATRSNGVSDAYLVARRAAVVPAPLVGGLLYGFGAELAFGLATCVGLLGCREFLRFVRRSRA
ncbi:hypothetical protein [Haladaptatus salinisoli]|uniref:hypothetical protein n=1 Tax=Haladaptatus salinisoli TaxID=2884876 RepID=UPI001D0BE0EE|nr:hypothetical protein [Haladaptatus salinisoli]